MISHIVSAFSGKPVFGQDGPYNQILSIDYYATYYMQEGKVMHNTTIIGGIQYLMYIVFIIVTMYYVLSNPQVTNAQAWFSKFSLGEAQCWDYSFNSFSMLVGTSETVRMFSNYQTAKQKKELKIRQWIAGIIDGDGYIGITKKGYCTIEIVMEVRDIACLIKFKNRYGGSIKSISGGNAFRYRLHHKQGLIQFIIDINGMLYNPTRIEQFKKLCNLYNIDFSKSPNLNFNSAYLSGLFDTDGSIYMNITSYQVFITISQKRRYLIDMICSIYGGKVYNANKDKTAFK